MNTSLFYSAFYSWSCLAHFLRARIHTSLLILPIAVLAFFFSGMTLGSVNGEASPGPPPVGWSTGASLPAGFGLRWDYSVAYFPPTDQVVVFGGAPDSMSGSWKNDTWLYSPGSDSWQQGPAAPAGLKPRSGAAMAFDPSIDKLVLFGGSGPQWPPYAETWLYDGTHWTQGPAVPAAMGGRVGSGMVYDDALGKMVLFSGSGTIAYNDTWFFNGANWAAGPASPAALKARVNFGMSYDPVHEEVIVAGGDSDVDVWRFDGTTWTASPPMPTDVGARERMELVYDPQVGGHLLFGGIGPAGSWGDGWIYRPGEEMWIHFLPDGSGIKPGARFSNRLVWVPTRDTMIMIGGSTDVDDGVPINETWSFREVPPRISSLDITPTNPTMVMSVTMVAGAVTGGYGDLQSERQWFINGVAVPGGTFLTLSPQYVHGDQIQAKWRMRDGLGVYGPWVSSPIVTVVDRVPVINSLSVDPPSPVMTDTVQAYVATSDPDGDTVFLDYSWTVNGVTAGGNTSSLDPSHYTANDTIGLTVTPTDSFGMPGAPASAAPAIVAYNLTIDPGLPGGIPRTQGRGYQPNETVDVRIDSPSGQILDSWAVDDIGRWTWENVPLPASLPGGIHVMYGTGRSSGKVGQGLVTILPGTKITPTKFPAGATVTWSGVGFVSGETVTVGFPNGQTSSVVASPNGDATVVLTSPPQPNTGGVITGSAPSGTVTAPFSVTSVLVAPPTGVRGAVVPVSVTGFGAHETVNVTFDSQTPVTGVTDSFGSLTVSLPLSGLFGKHQVYATGLGSGISLSKAITLVSTMAISPKSGPRGTVVTITSGPGWKPNERLQFTVGTRTLTAKTADASGSLTFTYTISALDPIGALQIKLYSPVLLQTARATFTVTA